jgi:hypothetical protein
VTIALAGQANIAGASGASPGVLTRTTTANNTLVVAGHLYDNNTGHFVAPTGITDTAGNLWQVSTNAAQSVLITPSGAGVIPPTASLTDPPDGASAHVANFVAWCVKAKAVTSVSVAFAGGVSTFQRLALGEFSDVGAFDNSWAGGSTTTTTSVTSGPVNLPGPGCLVVGALDLNTGGTQTNPASWVKFTSQAGQAYFLAGATAGPYSPVWTYSVAGSWAGAVAVFTPTSLLPQQARHRAPATFTRIAGRRREAVYR